MIYFCTLLAAAVATAFLIAPTAFHRMMWQQREKPEVIRTGNLQFVAGLASLALAMIGAVTLVTDVLFKGSTLVVTAVAISVLFAWLWFGYGLVRRVQTSRT
jgi:hypothetical protein